MAAVSLKYGVERVASQLVYYQLKYCNTSSNVRFYCKSFTSYSFLTNNCCSGAIKLQSFRLNSTKAAVEAKAVKHQQSIKSYFLEQVHKRQNQALRSVVIETNKKEDIPCAFAHCEKYGIVKGAYSYSNENQNFLLLEFSDQGTVEALLKNCVNKNIPGVIPVTSHLLHYEKVFETSLSKVQITEETIPKSSLKSGASISEIIQDIYLTEKLTELDVRLRYFFCMLLNVSISGLFPNSRVLPFGSSINGIGGHGCDLDVVFILDSKQVQGSNELFFVNRTYFGKNYQQKIMYTLSELFRAFLPGVSHVERILHARVPLIKMYHDILKLQCDLSADNLLAFHMSHIIHFCGEIDDRVRPLVYVVKKWAKEAEVATSGPNAKVSSFGLTNLVIFFLQNRPKPILPSFSDAIVIGDDSNYHSGVVLLKSIEELKDQASLNEESLAVLLKEFLVFLGTENFEDCIISLLSGKKRTRSREDRVPMWIQYPCDESLNVTKHISSSEFKVMQKKAKISAEFLESNMKKNNIHDKDFNELLGIPSIRNINAISEVIDENS